MSDGSITLGRVAGRLSVLEVACTSCERYGRLSIAKLVGEHGRKMDMPTLRGIIAADCSRQQAVSIYDRCGVYYPQLPGLF